MEAAVISTLSNQVTSDLRCLPFERTVRECRGNKIVNHARKCKALFRFKNFLDFDTVALSFLFDKCYPILEQLGLKDSSRDLQVNCAISFLFYLYLMFHAYAARFDVMGNLINFGCI